jgi:hypothetical protein
MRVDYKLIYKFYIKVYMCVKVKRVTNMAIVQIFDAVSGFNLV